MSLDIAKFPGDKIDPSPHLQREPVFYGNNENGTSLACTNLENAKSYRLDFSG